MNDLDLTPRPLGETGLMVSPLSLGTMTFGDGAWRAGERAAEKILDSYLELGGNSIDTADAYGSGRSETLIGRWLDGRDRDSVVLATKGSAPTAVGDPNARGNGRKHLVRALDRSLERLRTEYVDIFWLHLWDGVTSSREVVETLTSFVRQGKARFVGLSNVPAWYAVEARAQARLAGLLAPGALQLEYSLADRAAELELCGAARATGMSIAAFSPLAGGLLSAKYEDASTAAGRLTAASEYPDVRDHGDRGSRIVAALVAIAAEMDRPPEQVAIAWLLGRPSVATVILGARTVEQLIRNLGATSVALSDEQVARLDRVSEPAPVGSPYRLLATAPG